MTFASVSLSAALIVRNEAAHITACLATLDGFVDDVVVVDTGSTDATVELAHAAGVDVLHHVWDGDFAAARNVALAACQGDWILYIDADERASGGAKLRSALHDPRAVAGLVEFTVATGQTPYLEYRLFRNRADIRFRGRIHETVVPDIHRLVAAGAGHIVTTDLRLDHLGYDGDLRAKHARNLPLLKKAVRVTPDRAYLWHEMARAHLGLGEFAEGTAALLEGRRRALKGEMSAVDALIWTSLVEDGIRRDDAVVATWIEEGLTYFPDNWLLLWLSATVALQNGRTRQARVTARRILTVDTAAVVDQCLAFDQHIFGSWPTALIGASYFADGRFGDAAKWFERAAQLDPEDASYRARQAVAETRAGSL